MAVNSMSSMIMVLAVVVLWTASTATASSGVGTFYEKYIPSACYGNRDMGNMVAAASDSFWNGAVCGRCYRVKYTGAAYGGSGNPCKGGSSVVVNSRSWTSAPAAATGARAPSTSPSRPSPRSPTSTPARSRSTSTPRVARRGVGELEDVTCFV